MTMTNDEILERLHLSSASEDVKQETLQLIVETVDMRVMGVLSQVLPQETIDELSGMEQRSTSREEMFRWLVEDKGVNTGEIYDAALSEYVDEMVARTQPQQ
ncbi:MAG: hypothetical protein ABIP74_03530 [Candidatus Saccharimonas sp.]